MNLEQTLKDLTKDEILDRLRIDSDYYGEFGQQFMSNSDIGALNGDISTFRQPTKPSPALVIGGAFHTMMLEPHKMVNYPVIDIASRKTKTYERECPEGEIRLIRPDMELLTALREKLVNHTFRFGGKSLLELVEEGEPEVPGYQKIFGQYWKGKADVLNHKAKLIVDLKTTSNLEGFKLSANKWNYDSQAYIYRELFGYDMCFLIFCKKTHRVAFAHCTPEFYASGRKKVVEAVYNFKHKYNKEPRTDFDDSQYLYTITL